MRTKSKHAKNWVRAGASGEVRPDGAWLQGLLTNWLPRVSDCKYDALDFEARGSCGVFFTCISHQDGHQLCHLSLRCQGYLTLLNTTQAIAQSIQLPRHSFLLWNKGWRAGLWRECTQGPPLCRPFPFPAQKQVQVNQERGYRAGNWCTNGDFGVRHLGFTSGLCDLPAEWHWTCRLCPEPPYPFVSSKCGPYTESMSISWALVGNTETPLSPWTHWLLITV